MDALLSDIRFAIRSLGKSKTFTVVALLSLALGIGVNVTVFSMVNALAFKPLPYIEPDRLVDVSEWSATKLCSGCGVGTSYDGFLDWRSRARSFSAMGAYVERPFNISGAEDAARIGGALVSAEVFDLLGVHPVLGRGFQSDDDRVGAAPVVLISDGLWVSRYGADRRIVGQSIRVNGVAHMVVGVMPPRFKFPEFAELWVPFVPNAAGSPRSSRDFGVVARLEPRVSVAQANAEMATIAKAIEHAYPETQREWTARVSPFRAAFRDAPPELYAAMLGAVTFVLLIICANLAGLLLARGAHRQREIAIRLALGASRRQIVRHLLTESILLAIAGGALGLLVAVWSVDFAVQAIGRQAPFYVQFGIDTSAMSYCAGVSVLAGVMFGLFPALRASALDVHRTLKESGATTHRSRARGLLVVGEIALAMVLLAGAGAMVKSFLTVSAPERGYDERGLLSGDLEFLDARYADLSQARLAQSQIVERLRNVPGVAAAASDRFEFVAGFGRSDQTIRVEGSALVRDGISPRFYHVVSPGYFNTVKLPIVAGRGFTSEDRAGAMPVVIVNRGLAEALWPNESPLGRRVRLGPADSLPWLTVVGVTADITATGRNGTQYRNYAYVPAEQSPSRRATLLIRPRTDAATLVPAIRAAVRAVDPDLPVQQLQTIEQKQHDNYWPYELFAIAMSLFAGFAVLLAAIGLYGVIAYDTTRRTREIGVRIALGADARHVVSLVASQGGRLVALGVVAGTVGAVVLLRTLQAAFVGTRPVDPVVFALVSTLLALVAMLAIWLPARRAARIDPLEALRAE
ncbi:MAG TPA: ABC transporter permease [Gemmatimonadaceae bacterium]|nr:ABC transporter permease [Gemmatimonadaceae bacterium]